MAEFAGKWWWGLRSVWMVLLNFLLAFVFVSAERDLRIGPSTFNGTESSYFLRAVNFLWQPHESSYQHVWPEMKFGWQIVVGTVIGFCGAACWSIGGVGGGGIFVPMLTLIIGFDPKSAAAISKSPSRAATSARSGRLPVHLIDPVTTVISPPRTPPSDTSRASTRRWKLLRVGSTRLRRR